MTDHHLIASETPWRALPGLDQLLVAPSDPAEFMAMLLDLLITIPGIDAAWIGYPGEDGCLLPEVVRAPEMGVLHDKALMINLRSGAHALGPAARAWTTGQAALSLDIMQDDGLGPWRQDWLRLGFRVSASIPLKDSRGSHRLLSLYSSEPAFFKINWPVGLLTEFGTMIGTAIESRINHQALQRSNRLLDTLMVGFETLLDPADETTVLQGVCARLSETGLFVGAAIGWVDRDGVFGYPIAAGKDAPNVRRLHQDAAQDGSQQLLGLSAWKTGCLQTVEHYAVSRSLAPWREIALVGGWQSAAAAPIRRGGEIIAVLFLVSDDCAVVDAETRRLVTQLVGNIGRALDEIDLKSALRAEREAQSTIARRDGLTDLPNRRAFEEFLPRALAHAASNGIVMGIGMLDLDNFKPINDRFGHAAGDTVLRTLGRRLRSTLREGDFIARFGGDEFALIIDDLSSVERIEGFFGRLGDVIAEPIVIEPGESVTTSASLGVTFFPADHLPPETLIRHADMALYASKATKASRTRFWTTYQQVVGTAPVQSHYRRLLNHEFVVVHYQPVVTVRTGAVTAIEALARLRDGDDLLSPAQFLPELTAVDREILFDQVLSRGIADLACMEVSAPGVQLSVNVDAEVLARGRVPAMIEAVLASSGLAPSRLIIELLESHDFPDHDMATAQLGAIRAMGVIIAIDDLGVEFSTLSRVQRLPVDHLKIDKVFLAEVMANPNDLTFLAGYITMAASLSLTLCIEGVETIDMLDALRILGAPLAQGYGIARPMPIAALQTWLVHGQPRPIKGPPRTLLGAYALHIRWVRVLLFAPNERALWHYLRRDSRLSLDMFLRRAGFDQSALGLSYEALMQLTDQPQLDVEAIGIASDNFRKLLAATITSWKSAAPSATEGNAAVQSEQGIAKRPIGQGGHTRGRRGVVGLVELPA